MTLPWVYDYILCFFWWMFGVSEESFCFRFYEDMTQILIVLYFSLGITHCRIHAKTILN
jgi:hypothetical protein